MPDIFFIGDTHFGHKKILEFEAEKRPFATIEEHDEKLVENWNLIVTKRDVVYHLGDVFFTGDIRILGRINGMKKLILGNHDSKKIKALAPFFQHGMYGVYKFEDCFLSHIPVHPSQFYRFKANIHGHLHSDIVKKYKWFKDKRYINVSAEHINLTPIAWDVLKNEIHSST